MRLLLDQNLSPRLVDRLSDRYELQHVHALGLGQASDDEIWSFARSEAMAIVTKDADFVDLAMLRGAPPRIVWLRLGNCTTAQVEALLRESHSVLMAWINETEDAVIALGSSRC